MTKYKTEGQKDRKIIRQNMVMNRTQKTSRGPPMTMTKNEKGGDTEVRGGSVIKIF